MDLTARYTKGIEFARLCHDGTNRKGSEIPYLTHVLAVSVLVLEAGGDESQAIAALLHDTAEDSGGERILEEIDARFGGDVAEIVRACSDSLVEDPAQKAPWWDRKVAYVSHLRTGSPSAALVSVADKTHNAESLLANYQVVGSALWDRFNKDSGQAGTLWYYTRLSEVLSERLAEADPLAQRLSARLAHTVQKLTTLVSYEVGTDPVKADMTQCLAREEQMLESLRVRRSLRVQALTRGSESVPTVSSTSSFDGPGI